MAHCDITNVISSHGPLEANISHDTTNHPAHQRHAGTGEASSRASSLQNERFVRDFLQKSHVKSPKRAFRRRLPQELTCQSLPNERFVRDFLRQAEAPIGAQAALPSSFAIPAPPNNTHSHANPYVTATFTSTTTHNLTIPLSCELQQNVHHTTRLEWFRPVLRSTKIAISAETCHENRASTQHSETQTDLTKRCACAVKSPSTLQHLIFPHASTLFHTNLMRHVSIRNPPKLPPMAGPHGPTANGGERLRTVADGCERLRTVANAETKRREQGSTPRPPELNENPSLRIQENWPLTLKHKSLDPLRLCLLLGVCGRLRYWRLPSLALSAYGANIVSRSSQCIQRHSSPSPLWAAKQRNSMTKPYQGT